MLNQSVASILPQVCTVILLPANEAAPVRLPGKPSPYPTPERPEQVENLESEVYVIYGCTYRYLLQNARVVRACPPLLGRIAAAGVLNATRSSRSDASLARSGAVFPAARAARRRASIYKRLSSNA